MKLVECVPNFSEGRDPEKIRAIAREIEATPGVKLLDVDPGASTHRTVVTFVGTPEASAEAAFRAIRKAAEVIDMTTHKGAHSRIGATDVCPFVPLAGTTMADCVRLARELGRRVADELGIPVYLYEEAAASSERRNLASIRQGEYEGLPDKLKDPAWMPDFGRPVFNPRSGATVIGAREFLIAYNINLDTRDRKLASEIALNIRESGRLRRDKDGNIVRDASGEAVRIPGRFSHVKAVGWYIEDYGRAQISINFTNFKVTPVHAVFDEVRSQAARLGLRVTGSELVGLIPREALLAAGRHYLRRQGKSSGVPEEELIRQAVLSLGLNDVAPFDPGKKIIELQVDEAPAKLVGMDLRSFANEVSMDSPAPGGGSVAALCGALSASLSAMVANLTVGKKGYERVDREMDRTAGQAQNLKDRLLRAVDLDTIAFGRVMEALRLPQATAEQRSERQAALEAANREATAVPLGVLRDALALIDAAGAAAAKGNRNSLSDAGVAALTAAAAAEGAFYNVFINLPNLGDAEARAMIKKEAASLRRRILRRSAVVRKRVETNLRKKVK
ncbi:MAG: glutamate formimidoyltransferase [Candidatus Aminicenantes bacterium]|nr:glutamate formimidoyltransferase [Candidatus Aminicenantes bacterium]